MNTVTVAVVVDPDFGDRLAALVEQMPVWMADTPQNRRSLDRVRASYSGADVTTFKVDLNATAETWCEEELDMIELHHGPYSKSPPYSALQIYGAELTPGLRGALAELGFKTAARIDGGFRMTRLQPSVD